MSEILDRLLGPPDPDTAFAIADVPMDGYPAIRWCENTAKGRADARRTTQRWGQQKHSTFLNTCLWDADDAFERYPGLGWDKDRTVPPPKFVRTHTLWVDQDHKLADPALWDALCARGSVITHTRNYHLRLLLDEPITDPLAVEAWNAHLADKLGADSKHSIYAWLTMPGSMRFKAPNETTGDPGYPDGLRVEVVGNV